jgi:hypothetical protein
MPWYVGQPFGRPLDLNLTEDEIKRATVEDNKANPRFQTIEAWRANAETKLTHH